MKCLVHCLTRRMKTYKGASSGGQNIVTVDGLALPARYHSGDRRNVYSSGGKDRRELSTWLWQYCSTVPGRMPRAGMFTTL